MKVRFRLGPFTFGRSGTRLSLWSGGTGFSIPLTNRKKARSYGKVKLGIFSFLFTKQAEIPIQRRQYISAISKQQSHVDYEIPYMDRIKETHKQAYEPWTVEADEKLLYLLRKGKSIKELSEIFGRTRGAILSRINRLLKST